MRALREPTLATTSTSRPSPKEGHTKEGHRKKAQTSNNTIGHQFCPTTAVGCIPGMVITCHITILSAPQKHPTYYRENSWFIVTTTNEVISCTLRSLDENNQGLLAVKLRHYPR